MNKPISITAIINTYNRADVVGRAFRSVDQQTLPVSEIVIVDDGSTDDTSHVINAIQGQSRIPVHYIRTLHVGLPAARNAGLRAAKSEYVAFLDDDDIWLPDHTKRCHELTFIHPNAVLYSGRTLRFGMDATQLTPLPTHLLEQYLPLKNNLLTRVKTASQFVAPFFAPHLSTSMILRQAALQSPFDEELRLRADILFVWRLGSIGDIVLEDCGHAILDQLDISLASAGPNTAHSEKLAIDIKRAYFATKLMEKAINGRGIDQCHELYRMQRDAHFDYAYCLAKGGRRSEAWAALNRSMSAGLQIRHLKMWARILIGRHKSD